MWCMVKFIGSEYTLVLLYPPIQWRRRAFYDPNLWRKFLEILQERRAAFTAEFHVQKSR